MADDNNPSNDDAGGSPSISERASFVSTLESLHVLPASSHLYLETIAIDAIAVYGSAFSKIQ